MTGEPKPCLAFSSPSMRCWFVQGMFPPFRSIAPSLQANQLTRCFFTWRTWLGKQHRLSTSEIRYLPALSRPSASASNCGGRSSDFCEASHSRTRTRCELHKELSGVSTLRHHHHNIYLSLYTNNGTSWYNTRLCGRRRPDQVPQASPNTRVPRARLRGRREGYA